VAHHLQKHLDLGNRLAFVNTVLNVRVAQEGGAVPPLYCPHPRTAAVGVPGCKPAAAIYGHVNHCETGRPAGTQFCCRDRCLAYLASFMTPSLVPVQAEPVYMSEGHMSLSRGREDNIKAGLGEMKCEDGSYLRAGWRVSRFFSLWLFLRCCRALGRVTCDVRAPVTG
jgi:hypothetical protein